MDRVRFERFSPFVQLGHIAAEVGRARVWAQKGRAEQSRGAVARALELLGISLAAASSPVWEKEFSRLKEVLTQFHDHGAAGEVTLAELEDYLTKIIIAQKTV